MPRLDHGQLTESVVTRAFAGMRHVYDLRVSLGLGLLCSDEGSGDGKSDAVGHQCDVGEHSFLEWDVLFEWADVAAATNVS
mmetsp:Transcript_16986/g.26372  ORF Transcript_16986/g.26372 Transcript_16986/m.26372 type:complete len:81 (+) Transcript_16986:266-508(+)